MEKQWIANFFGQRQNRHFLVNGKGQEHLTQKDEIVKIELETAETLNSFFVNVINNLKISNITQ